MLARLQTATSLLLLASAIGWALWSIVIGRPGLAWVGAGTIAAGYSGILGLEFWLLWRSYPASDPNRPSIRELLSCWWKECAAAPRVFLWRQPFRSGRYADLLTATGGRNPGILLVHGFICNRGLWNPWMRRLEAEGIPFVAVDLEPVFGSIGGYTDILDRAVHALECSTGRPPLIVAHSMGGLAVRAWIAQGNEMRFSHAVTIATPHQGTRIARRGFSANTREMGIESPWLHRLRQREDPAIYRRFTCFWGHCDNIVFPTENATLPSADNRHLKSTPHVQMVFHPAVLDEVLRLTADSPLPTVNQGWSGTPRSAPGATPPPARG